MSVINRSRPPLVGAPPETKRLDIQGLRAVAVLLVMAFHADLPVRGGFAGVDVFFVISGYVITHQLLNLRARNELSFARFYAGRVRRLLPAMVAMVLAVLILAFLLQSPLGPQAVTAKTAAGALLLAANAAILKTSGGYFDAAATTNPLLHTWSLAVEEQFYLIFPLILMAAWRVGRGRSAVWAVGVLTATTFAVSTVLSYRSGSVLGTGAQQVAFYSPTRAWEFGVGALLAFAASRMARLPRNGARLAACGGVALLVGMNAAIGENAWPGLGAVLPVSGTALLIAAGTIRSTAITRLLALRPLVIVGDLSYSLYLWHWPAIVFAKLLWPQSWIPAVAALASILPAWLSYRFVEKRFRRAPVDRREDRWRIYRPALVAVAGGVTTAGVLFTLGSTAIPGAAQYETERAVPTFGRKTGCMLDNRTYQSTDQARCTVTRPGAKGWIMLVGDSHADAISTGVVTAAGRAGYDVLALTGAGCPFARDGVSNLVPNCGQMQSDLLDRATGNDPPALVIMSHWFAPQVNRDRAWAEETLAPAMKELRSARLPMLSVLDVPNFAASTWAQSSACRGGWLNFTCTRTASEIERYQGTGRAAELRLAQETGAKTFDTWPTFCRAGTCTALVDGELAYWDFDHLNGTGSAALTDGLERAIHASASRG